MPTSYSNNLIKLAEILIDKLKRKITEATTPVISKEQKAGEDKLLETLRQMETDYKNNNGIVKPDYDKIYPTTLGLIKKTYNPISDAEIEKQVKDELTPEYESKVQKKEAEAEFQLDKLADKEIGIKEDAEDDVSKELNEFQNNLISHTNSLIKKGMVNSSVKSEGERAIEEETKKDIQTISEEYSLKLSSLNKEIEYLKVEKENALYDYEISYAANLEKRISALKKQVESELNKVNAYNEKIDKKEADYQAKRQKLIYAAEYDRLLKQEELETAARNFGETFGYSDQINKEYYLRYKAALEFYSSLPSDVAKKMAEENTGLSDYMGKYYDLLKSKL